MTARSGRWIPPQGLAFGHLAHGVSYLLLLNLALSPGGALLRGLGWLHLVVLGWLTMTALSVLVHVIPAFTDAVWRGGTWAQRSLVLYALGVVVLVAGFCTNTFALLPWGGTAIALGLLGYAVPAAFTLAGAFRLGRAEAAVARALCITLAVLLLTAGLGVAFTWALSGHAPGMPLALAAPAHGELGLIGWLTVLVMGVSAKTVGPIAGGRSQAPWRHVAAAGASMLATIVLAAGFALRSGPLQWAAFIILTCGIAIYITDIALVLRRATVRHRPPQAFLAASITWLAIALVLFAGVLAGRPWAAACIFVTLLGWLGGIVNTHIHHIGVRLLATIFRGDDDETRPGELLSAPLSWTAFAFFQIAVGAGAVGILASTPAVLACAAGVGFAGWIAMTANAAHAVNRARVPAPVISLI